MNKNVFTYLFKSKKILVVFLFIMNLALMLTPYISSMRTGNYFVSWIIGYVFMFGTCYILPPYLLRFIQSKKATDSYFSLPVSRRELLNTNLLFSALVSYCPFLVGAVISGIIGLAGGHIEIAELFRILFCGLLTVTVLTLVNSLFFSFANTLFDGMVMIAAYTAMPLMIYIVLGVFFETHVAGMSYWSSLLNGVRYLSPAFLCGNIVGGGSKRIVYYIVLAVYAVIAYVLLSREVVDRKAERAEQISDHFFAYPFVIYFYTFAILCMITFFWGNRNFISFFKDSIIYYILLLFIFTIANFVYRRKIRFEPKTFVFFAISIILSLLVGLAANKTQGFGFSRMYDHNPKSVSYVYNGPLSKEDCEELEIKSEYVSVFVELQIPERLMNEPQYSEAMKIMEDSREKAIEDYYTKSDQDRTNTGYLSIRDNFTGEGNYVHYDDSGQYGYTVYEPLSIDQLRVLSKITQVSIYTDDKELILP